MTSDDPITADNVYERSRKNSLFEGLNEEQIKTIFSISKEITLEKDCYLMHEGDPAQEIFLIIDGQMEVNRYDAKHQQNHTINTLGAGDTVGEVSLLDDGLRSASVCAKSSCRLLSISFDDLRAIASKDKFSDKIHQIVKSPNIDSDGCINCMLRLNLGEFSNMDIWFYK